MYPSSCYHELQSLQNFVEFASKHPRILNLPQLDFFKKLIEQFGGKVPAGPFIYTFPEGRTPFSSNKPDPSKGNATATESESDPESDLELDMEGVIDADEVETQSMDYDLKTPSEEEIDQANNLRAQASAACAEEKFEDAINLLTKAIGLNAGNALFYAKRGQAYLQLKKPNACIRDCDKALELNCDSAAAYKYRGRAHRLLGNFELAAKDLRQACKLDFDEETDEWLREVTPNAKSIEQYRIKQERKNLERKVKETEKCTQNNGSATTFANTSGSAHASTAKFSLPGGFPDISADKLPHLIDMISNFGDPEVCSAVQDMCANPKNVGKYLSNPKVAGTLKSLWEITNAEPEERFKPEEKSEINENSNGNDIENRNPQFDDDGLD